MGCWFDSNLNQTFCETWYEKGLLCKTCEGLPMGWSLCGWLNTLGTACSPTWLVVIIIVQGPPGQSLFTYFYIYTYLSLCNKCKKKKTILGGTLNIQQQDVSPPTHWPFPAPSWIIFYTKQNYQRVPISF